MCHIRTDISVVSYDSSHLTVRLVVMVTPVEWWMLPDPAAHVLCWFWASIKEAIESSGWSRTRLWTFNYFTICKKYGPLRVDQSDMMFVRAVGGSSGISICSKVNQKAVTLLYAAAMIYRFCVCKLYCLTYCNTLMCKSLEPLLSTLYLLPRSQPFSEDLFLALVLVLFFLVKPHNADLWNF